MSKKLDPTPYELATHKGRQIDEAREPGYCGSCSIEIHCAQVRDPKSWVHSSIKRWEQFGGLTPAPVETKYATIDRDELKRLQKDAERYRFLRACESWEDALPLMADSIVSRYVETINLTGDDLDRAIDAAMLSAQGDGHE